MILDDSLLDAKGIMQKYSTKKGRGPATPLMTPTEH
jgi:hypothetical protein